MAKILRVGKYKKKKRKGKKNDEVKNSHFPNDCSGSVQNNSANL